MTIHIDPKKTKPEFDEADFHNTLEEMEIATEEYDVKDMEEGEDG